MKFNLNLLPGFEVYIDFLSCIISDEYLILYRLTCGSKQRISTRTVLSPMMSSKLAFKNQLVLFLTSSLNNKKFIDQKKLSKNMLILEIEISNYVRLQSITNNKCSSLVLNRMNSSISHFKLVLVGVDACF